MPEPPKCPQCGTPLATGVPGQLCLRCLLEFGLQRDQDPASEENQPVPDEDDVFPGYRILERIGEGGCGVVCRAAQIGAVQREVAIKVIKPGMDSRAVLSRFAAERQALALMEHPNIARVFDAGITGRGRPFIVMELVEGERITEYCDRRRLSVPQRLGLFVQVCEAVRHAHHKGVIHRDIKPSNILVAETDGQAVPKVIDFGVAKAMGHQRLADQTIYTAFDQFVGTPAYMSPEQAGLTGEDIDARSDVYSLGVLLYELLTGRPPFEPERLRRAAIDEVCRIIREEDPSLPSARLTALGDAELTATARHRLLPSQRLVVELRGDLDGIVMKALRKNRDHRYDTAHELAADIVRHLRNEPVFARAPGALYQFGKFAKRHKLGIAATAAVLGALVCGLAVSSWMFVKEKRARERLEHRAYLSDMNAASRMAQLPVGGLAGTANLLAQWQRKRPESRGWEWHFLNGLCRHDLLTIRADDRELWSVSWSPDETRIASGGADGFVKTWDATTGEGLQSWPDHPGGVKIVAWSPDGRWLASAGIGGKAIVRDLQAGTTQALTGHTQAVTSLAWAPDGKRLASGGADSTVRIWDSGQAWRTTTFHTGKHVQSVCWNGDGSRLFATGIQGLTKCWDTTTGDEVWDASRQATAEVGASACSPDGRELATGGSDNAISFRNALTGTDLVSLFDNQNVVLAIAWAPDGQRLATATRGDGRVAIRSTAAGGRVIRDFRGHLGSVRSISWCPDGQRLASASADGTVKIWDTTGSNPSLRTIRHPDQAKALAWSPDGQMLAVGSRRTAAWIWEIGTETVPHALDGGFTEWTHGIAWHPRGNLLATVCPAGLDVWNSSTCTVVWRDHASQKNLRAVAWNHDGSRIAAVGLDRKLALWDATTGKIVNSTLLPNTRTNSLAWSPDGQRIATGTGNDICLWTPDLKLVRTLVGHREGIHRLAWSPDGTLLASAGADTSARVWDPSTGQVRHILLSHGAPVYGIAWSPDGKRLATGGWDMFVKVWDTDTSTEICSFDKPAGIVQMIDAVAWSPDGRRIAASDIEGQVGILDATPGWRAEAGLPPLPESATNTPSNQETIRALRLYCETVEPHAHDDADALRRLAWIRATARYPEVRDGHKAVLQAERANELTSGNNPGILHILAAAYAESGDFPKAVATQLQAISSLGSVSSKSAYQANLRLYRSGQPCRDDSW